MKHFIPLLLLFVPHLAQATFNSVTVEGASRYVVTTTAAAAQPTPGAAAAPATVNAVTIYAGLADIAGTQTCNVNSDGTCNNCTTAALSTEDLRVCNPKRIVATNTVKIRYSSSVAGYGYLIAKNANSVDSFANTGFLAANSIGELTVTWTRLCISNVLFTTTQSPTCAFTARQTATLILVVSPVASDPPDTSVSGVEQKNISIQMIPRSCPVAAKDDTAPAISERAACTTDLATDGIQSWKVVAGDSKVYLKDFSTLGGTLTTFGEGAGIRLYYTEVPLASCTTAAFCAAAAKSAAATIRNGSTNYFETSFNTISTTSPELGTDRFSGNLLNDRIYAFKLAMVDMAGNVSHFTPDEYFNARNEENTGNAITQAQGKGIHAASPGEVVGILDQSQCFVATAAFGSPLHAHVETLRKFRDRFLMTNPAGRALVRSYYKWGPMLADAIRDHESARLAARLILYPTVLFAWIANTLEPWLFFSLLGGLIVAALLHPSPREGST